MRKPRVLVIDDNEALIDTITRYLGDHGFQVEATVSGAEAADKFEAMGADVVLTDLRMKDFDGLDVLDAIHRLDAQAPVVLMTAFGNVESAVDAIQRGAYHYITKPFKMATMRILIERAAHERLMRDENTRLRTALAQQLGANLLVGQSPAIVELKNVSQRLVEVTRPVLLTGETGTGKELVARLIHLESARRDGPFVGLGCAGLTEEALDAELFGRARAPGAAAKQVGRCLFAEADGGTLFLGAVDALPPALQAKLLQVLESGEVRSPGANAPRRVDVRLIAATDQDLARLTREGRFREDLLFRLNAIPLQLPALRARRGDIPFLVDHFLARAQTNAATSRVRAINADAVKALSAYDWPGNVRELENVVERLVVTSTHAEIDADEVLKVLGPVTSRDPFEALVDGALTLGELEDRYIEAVLRRQNGNRSRAAAVLGVDTSTLYRRDKQRS
jgi:two-component system response regulator HydG